MQDEPTPVELAKAVADFLRNDIAPAITGHNAFKLRVAINMLDLVGRQLTLAQGERCGGGREPEEVARHRWRLIDLNRALAEKIASGEIDLATPGLSEHLWQTTMAKLAVDQPNYGSYKRELERDGNA